jgi:predicted transcriptional regulator
LASIKKLPDAEFEIMKIIWRNPSPMYEKQFEAVSLDKSYE